MNLKIVMKLRETIKNRVTIECQEQMDLSSVNTNFEKEHPKEQEDEQSESSHALETIPRTQMQMIRPFDYICEDAVNVVLLIS